jgi:hypothetical protein
MEIAVDRDCGQGLKLGPRPRLRSFDQSPDTEVPCCRVEQRYRSLMEHRPAGSNDLTGWNEMRLGLWDDWPAGANHSWFQGPDSSHAGGTGTRWTTFSREEYRVSHLAVTSRGAVWHSVLRIARNRLTLEILSM